MLKEISLKRQHTSNSLHRVKTQQTNSLHNHCRENLISHIFILSLHLLDHPMSAIQPFPPSKICFILSPHTA